MFCLCDSSTSHFLPWMIEVLLLPIFFWSFCNVSDMGFPRIGLKGFASCNKYHPSSCLEECESVRGLVFFDGLGNLDLDHINTLFPSFFCVVWGAD